MEKAHWLKEHEELGAQRMYFVKRGQYPKINRKQFEEDCDRLRYSIKEDVQRPEGVANN